jgi:hypothetical protein
VTEAVGILVAWLLVFCNSTLYSPRVESAYDVLYEYMIMNRLTKHPAREYFLRPAATHPTDTFFSLYLSLSRRVGIAGIDGFVWVQLEDFAIHRESRQVHRTV